MEIYEYTPGTFCWIELVTSDGDGAKKFYADLFGLGFNDQPVGADAVYTMLNKEGKNVAALYQMNEEQKSKVFEPFYTTKRGQGCMGLGMHIIYNLVTQWFKGKIYCESEPGKGKNFIIILPSGNSG